MRIPCLLILFINLACIQMAAAQDQTYFTDQLINLPARFNERIQKKTEKLEAQLTRQTEKYLQRIAPHTERSLQNTHLAYGFAYAVFNG